MVRILDPQGGTATLRSDLRQRRHAQSGQRARSSSTAAPAPALYGQEDNGAVWAICRMNMLLHGIPDADIRNGDTLAEPKHIEDGRLMRFDRVIANPPFSQNYTKRGIAVHRSLPLRLVPDHRQEGRPHVRPAHAGGAQADREDGGGHAARRAVPGWRGEEDPDRAARRTTASRRSSACRRIFSMAPASRPAFWSCASRAGSPRSAQGQGALHQRGPRVSRRSGAELHRPRAHREDRQRLRRLYRRARFRGRGRQRARSSTTKPAT